MAVKIYHNPKCGTSRNTLAMIRASGEEPEVIEYLKTPLDRQALMTILHAIGGNVRDVMRKKESLYTELDLDADHVSDDALISAMLAHPILINRPIVVTPKGTMLCRPSEMVLDILENPHIGTFVKEDGEVVSPK